jgi:LacI family transcriptional regulator
MDSAREAPLDGTKTFVLSIPLPKLAEETIAGMIRAVSGQSDSRNDTNVLPIEIYTRENA